jgi:AcrR family transcriptional regulator
LLHAEIRMSMTTESVVSTSKAAARIRAAAIEAFAEHGYGGTTTRDIAARSKPPTPSAKSPPTAYRRL